ncbi:MAG: methylenetetrahydrofolate--tRNA-(uracil(54)-C(5))-methyltransferase (FADH(2)-oxidizing) TrmFO [Coriobacteriia bacterium]
MDPVTIIGAGLAGSEAAWQLASRGVPVRLVEMRPVTSDAAHHTDDFAELVCSNSFKSDDPHTAAGLLKRELEDMGSLLLAVARETAVPAGGALAVDRALFSERITRTIEQHPLIEVRREEATAVPEGNVILAAGPLASEPLTAALAELTGPDYLAFFDAAAPIIDADTIDRHVVFPASRWGKGGESDYLNCPMDRAQYQAFIEALLAADRVTLREFERKELFQACQPVEEVARTGLDALRFGALKPVGLLDPSTGERPWAVVQLRAENREGSAHNLVGFQTNLTFGEQQRVFRMIPGLEHAAFLRYGVMHRNTFIDAPRLLNVDLSLRATPRVRVAGQLSGTEGYLEAVASGLVAALGTYSALRGAAPPALPPTTALGSLLAYATDPSTAAYQPMHVNFGLVPPLAERVRGKQARYAAYSDRARAAMRAFVASRSDLFGVSPTGTVAATRPVETDLL